jgi:radical SAM-linked protein
MRTVLKFRKDGPARYISHLDLMRAMNRALLRSGLPVQWSQGFHPHIITSYAQALGLGYQSEAEYMELLLADGTDLGQAAEALNHALPDGLAVLGAWALSEDVSTLMASVAAARWRVQLSVPVNDALFEAFRLLLDRETVDVVKEGKNGPVAMDIRPGLYSIERNNGCLELFLAAGSARNIRPELVVKAVLDDVDIISSMTRTELYASKDGGLVPLFQICIGGDSYGK